MRKQSPERLGDMSALVRASTSLAMPPGGDGINRRRKLVAMFCTMLGNELGDRELGEPRPNEADHENGGNGARNSNEAGSMIQAGPPLSRRERQTLELLLDGGSEKQIANGLAISRHTVHVYVKSLYKRFGVNSRPELLAKWIRR